MHTSRDDLEAMVLGEYEDRQRIARNMGPVAA
jgi:hypothetical protein